MVPLILLSSVICLFYPYQVIIDEAVRNAGRLFKEARVGAVKLEGELPKLLAALKK